MINIFEIEVDFRGNDRVGSFLCYFQDYEILFVSRSSFDSLHELLSQKHRSNLKFSLHGWVEGLSGKQRFSKPNNQLSFGTKLESSSNASHRVKDCATRGSSKATKPTAISNGVVAVEHCLDDAVNAMKPTSISNGDGSTNHCLDKCVISQNNEDLGSSHLAAKNTVDPSHKLVINHESTLKDNALPQIKWGDLDEGTLKHYGKVSGAEFEFGGVKNHNLVTTRAEGSGECLSCIVPLDPEETRSVGEQCLPESHSVSPRTVFMEETSEEVNDVSLEDVKDQITSEKIVCQSTSILGSNIEQKHPKQDNETTSHPSGENVACSDNREIEMIKSSNSLSEPSFSDVSVVPIIDAASSSRAVDVDSDKLLDCEPGNGVTMLAVPIEGCRDKKSKANSDGLLDAQNADAVNSDDVGESKERFRERLWCFLFENLNRAVDELYLLCELECDLEQMKEASLVLEEAASDFRELNSRVEKFEKLKRSSSHGADGSPLVMQSDHRRPHALSWEVSFPVRSDSNTLSFRFLIFTYLGFLAPFLIVFSLLLIMSNQQQINWSRK